MILPVLYHLHYSSLLCTCNLSHVSHKIWCELVPNSSSFSSNPSQVLFSGRPRSKLSKSSPPNKWKTRYCSPLGQPAIPNTVLSNRRAYAPVINASMNTKLAVQKGRGPPDVADEFLNQECKEKHTVRQSPSSSCLLYGPKNDQFSILVPYW